MEERRVLDLPRRRKIVLEVMLVMVGGVDMGNGASGRVIAVMEQGRRRVHVRTQHLDVVVRNALEVQLKRAHDRIML